MPFALALILTLAGFLTGGFVGLYVADCQHKKLWKTQQEMTAKELRIYRDALNLIRRERMLFTRHPLFRETANLISRLCS